MEASHQLQLPSTLRVENWTRFFESAIGNIVQFFAFLLQLFSRKKSICHEKQEILKWASDSAGADVGSLQQLWEIGPKSLGRYIEQLNSAGSTWWFLQDLARSTLAVPQVMTKQEMSRPFLVGNSERKFLRLLKRLKEALERAAPGGAGGTEDRRVSGDLMAKGVALSAAYAGLRGVFFLYSLSGQLDGIQVRMKGPGEVTIETKLRKTGLMVGYIACKAGLYELEVSKFGWYAPGSPFQVNVQDPPPGYRGNFGGSRWDTAERSESFTGAGGGCGAAASEYNSLSNPYLWDSEPENNSPVKREENSPNPPRRNKRNRKAKRQVVEISQIAAAIILARRFTNRMQNKIPELTLEKSAENRTDMNLWSITGSPPVSHREITYVSPDGATFPISVAGRLPERDGRHFDKWRDRDSMNSDEWGVQQSEQAPIGYGREPHFKLTVEPPLDSSTTPKSSHPFQRNPQNMVRPFSQGVSPFSRPLERDQNSRPESSVWTARVSVGVNTDGHCRNCGATKSAESKGVQVGRSAFSPKSFETPERKSENVSEEFGGNPSGSPKHRSDAAVCRGARKSETYNSDDTSSGSGLTNYSEKVIEMDLKVNYEAIALTDDELCLSSRVPNSPEFDASSLLINEREIFGEFNESAEELSKSSAVSEHSKNPADGVYKATLMRLESPFLSPEKVDGPIDGQLEVIDSPQSVLPSKIRNVQVLMDANLDEKGNIVKSPSNGDETMTLIIDEGPTDTARPSDNAGYSSGSGADGNVSPAEDSGRAADIDGLNKIKIRGETRRSKFARKKWASKLSTLRLINHSGKCRRHLRKTLSFIPRISDHRKLTSPQTNAVYSFGSYPVTTDVILSTPVQAWKNFWDDIISNRDESGVANSSNKRTAEEERPSILESHHADVEIVEVESKEERKKRFEMAKQHFKQLEKSRVFHTFPQRKKSTSAEEFATSHEFEQHWHFKDLFKDFTHGLGKPGVANRMGVLATLNSVHTMEPVAGCDPLYPHLPVTEKKFES
ncbi:Hypothetical protein NTJ_08002 [Nesidiocoris tenuis]|uniref:Uncharacterized protein n=1 Tax=Nesidiocoris tenuis TaxID=355587 RepID=A0ABN7AT11_9HEMI|nr:Hypothetical protein NTJ_08002 [Nesidiocoris tenuis]